MKHDFKTTSILLIWTIASIVFGISLVPLMSSVALPGQVSGWELAGMMIISVAIGTLVWFGILKFANKYTEIVMGVALGLMWSSLIGALGGSVWRRLLAYFAAMIGYICCIKLIQRDWKNAWWTAELANMYVVIAIAAAGASFAGRLAPWIAITLLGVIALYDAVAVWKTKHMQDFAMKFIEKGIVPGIGVPKKKKGKWALLGGGDIFFIVVVAGSFAKTSWPAVWISAFCMTSAVILLFAFSSPKKFYPAIPFIFAGQMVALLLMLLGVGL